MYYPRTGPSAAGALQANNFYSVSYVWIGISVVLNLCYALPTVERMWDCGSDCEFRFRQVNLGVRHWVATVAC